MRPVLIATALLFGVAGLSQPAAAIGCVSGAVLGGAAGHVAGHHGFLGAAAGCYAGHHAAVVRNRNLAAQRAQQQMQQQSPGAGQPGTDAVYAPNGAPR